MALENFFGFVSDFKGVAALIGKVALIAPFTTLLLNIGPPWPTRTAVPALTSLCEVFVLIYIFQFFTPLTKKALGKRLRLFFLLLVGSFILYISLYSFFVFDIPLTKDRDLKGFIVQPAIAQLVGPGRSLENLLEGAEWDPFNIWEGWTIYTTRVGLLLSWVLFFVGIAGCIAVFVTLQRKGVKTVTARPSET
jgi:hypothetical protein